MKKLVLSVLCLFLFSSLVFAQNAITGADGMQIPYGGAKSADGKSIDSANSDKEDLDDFYNELIQQEYGSNQSPDFQNRGNENPNESNYGYGS